MPKIKDILRATDHRPFALPEGKWAYYQEWNNVLFLHWKVPVEILKELVPVQFNIDTIDGYAYVSLVAFTMQKIRPRYLPAIKMISDFDEINIRTYIDNDGKKGVYFINIEAGKAFSAFLAKSMSGLPYEKARIQRSNGVFKSENAQKGFYLDSKFKIQEKINSKTELDLWLTERYCLYMDVNESMYRYDIQHFEWEIDSVEVEKLDLNYSIKNLNINHFPDLVQYSKGVQVIVWKRENA